MVGTIRKKYIKLVFACVLVSSAVFAGNDEELFLRGNKYYAQKDYDKAFHAYDMMSVKGRAVLYNMGNCLFYKEDYPRALVYWSRAQEGATSHEYNLIMRNKDYVLKKLGKQKEQSIWHSVKELSQLPILYISLFFLQLLFLICWWFFIFVMRTKQTGIKKVVQSCVCFFISISAMALGIHYMQQNTSQAIVVKKESTLFAGPDKSFHVLSPVMYADCATVKETREGWYKIQYADMIGWVEADVIQII